MLARVAMLLQARALGRLGIQPRSLLSAVQAHPAEAERQRMEEQARRALRNLSKLLLHLHRCRCRHLEALRRPQWRQHLQLLLHHHHQLHLLPRMRAQLRCQPLLQLKARLPDQRLPIRLRLALLLLQRPTRQQLHRRQCLRPQLPPLLRLCHLPLRPRRPPLPRMRQ